MYHFLCIYWTAVTVIAFFFSVTMGKSNKRGSEVITPPTVEPKRQTQQSTATSSQDNVSTQHHTMTQYGSFSPMYQYTPTYHQPFLPGILPVTPSANNAPLSPSIQPSPDATQLVTSLQAIVHRLDAMDTKLSQLSAIQTSINKINQRLDGIDKRLLEVEQSTSFVSDKFDEIEKQTTNHSGELQLLQSTVSSLDKKNSILGSTCNKLNEELIDLKCRSMRNNLLFFGIPELHESPTHKSGTSASSDLHVPPSEQYGTSSTSTTETTDSVDCRSKILAFCENMLKMNDPKSTLYIERAHRIGKHVLGKIRPIVVQFKKCSEKCTKKC